MLKDQFGPDFDKVFANETEFADAKKFEIMGLDKKPLTFVASVVWDTDTLKKRMIVQQQGVWLGEVLLFINKKWFPVEPKPEQVLYVLTEVDKRVVKKGWIVLDVVDAESVYEISLDRIAA